jgi:hypothetical protein
MNDRRPHGVMSRRRAQRSQGAALAVTRCRWPVLRSHRESLRSRRSRPSPVFLATRRSRARPFLLLSRSDRWCRGQLPVIVAIILRHSPESPCTSPHRGGIDHKDEPTSGLRRFSKSEAVQLSWLSPAQRRAGERAAEHRRRARSGGQHSPRLANESPLQSVRVRDRMPVGDEETIMPVTAGSPEGPCVAGSARACGVVGFVVLAVRQTVDSQSHRGSHVPVLPIVDS